MSNGQYPVTTVPERGIMITNSLIIKMAFAGVLVLTVSSCAQSDPTPTGSPSPTATQTQAQIDKEFIKIANDSCAKAQKENVVEGIINDAPARIIALARSNAYKDYSAVYIDSKGVTKVIYELELTVCQPGYLLSMQEEAHHDNSGDYEHHIKKNSATNYTWTQATYADEKTVLADTVFDVANGLMVKATSSRDSRTITYGPITTADMQALKDAVDAELERLE